MKDGTTLIDELKDRVHELYDENHKLKEEVEKLKEENNFLKQLIPNEKKYSYGIRMGSDEK